MKVLSPMSQEDEAEKESRERLMVEGEDEDFEDGEFDSPENTSRRTRRWRRKVEAALVKMTAEIAALREQVATGREYQERRKYSIAAWLGWLVRVTLQHIIVDASILGLVLLWMRKRKDRRIENLVREGLSLLRDYIRQLLPAR